MRLNSVILAIEDELSEVISSKILKNFGMEVESWLMADRNSFANFLSIPVNRIPSNTDDILNPKEFLVSLARSSKKRRLREELVPKPRTRIPIGYGYNTRLSQFVREHWNIERAATVSPSLKRTLDRLHQATRIGVNP